MNFALLWIDGLLVSLLWVAAWDAVTGRIKNRWIRGIFVLVTIGAPLFFLGTFTFAAGATMVLTAFEPNWFGYATSLLVTFVIGAFLILWHGRRRTPGLAPASASWPRGPLLFALLTAMAVGYMTLLNMDLVIRARCAIESVQVNCRYLAALPAASSYSQNAAPLYKKAFARLAADPPTDVKNPPTGNNTDFDPNEPATIAYLTRHSDTIALLRRAAEMSGFRFNQDLSAPDVTTMLADLNLDRQAANVLNLHAREELARGNAASAIVDANAILRMSRHVGRRPMIISGLVGVGIAALGDKTLELALPAITGKSEMTGLHLEELEPMGQVFQESLRGEEMFGLNIFGNMPPNPDNFAINGQIKNPEMMSTGSAGPAGAFMRVFFLNADGYVQLMEKLQELSAEPYCKIRQPLEEACGARSSNGLLTSILLPSLRRDMEAVARIEAYDAATRTAVAMTQYRLDHGSLPTQLSDLVPNYLEAIPLDPFDGQPIRLSIKQDRWIIYCIGPDLVDHGGIEKPAKGTGDVIFTLKATR